MKKLTKVSMIIASLAIALMGCGAKSESGTGASATNSGNGQATEAAAQDYPNKTINVLVPFTPGGGTDLMMRELAELTKSSLGQATAVINKDGASGTIGTTEAAKANPDGYNLFFSPTAPLTTQPLITKVKYKLDDFRVISGFAYEPVALAVRADSPWKTLEDLLKEKDSGKVIKHGQSGTGTFHHIAQAYFYKKAGIKAESVPFKGGNPSVTALLGGHVDTIATIPSELMPHVQAGKLRILAISTPERLSQLPDVPTFKEKGFDIEYNVGFYLLAPKDTPDAVVAKLEKAYQDAAKSKEFTDFLEKSYRVPMILTGKEAMEKLEKETTMYTGILKELGLIQ